MPAERIRDEAERERVRRSAGESAAPSRQAQDDERATSRKTAAVRARETAIDAALEMSFPASDPPPWTP